MGHTNSTANIALPQFIGTDKPTWLGDVNGAFSSIDTKVGTIDADIAATDAKADNAVADAASAVATATSANTTAGNASTTATNALNIANNALTVANNADGHTNQLETKVGLLADLHTTDKTSIVNAINETFDALPSGGSVEITADGVKSNSQLFDDLHALIDIDKITQNTVLVQEQTSGVKTYFYLRHTNSSTIEYSFFNAFYGSTNYGIVYGAHIKTSGSVMALNDSAGTFTDISNSVPGSGTKYTIMY